LQYNEDFESIKTRLYNLGKTGHFDMNSLSIQNKEEIDKNINENDANELEEDISVSSGNVNASKKRDDLVVPGQVMYFYRNLNDQMRAIISDYSISTLREIKLYTTSIDDHNMSDYVSILRGYCLNRQILEGKVSKIKLVPKQPALIKGTSNKYQVCGVCQADCMWPFITKNLPSRVAGTHNCKLCGSIVCVICAPAGESIPGEGIGQVDQLKDIRISLPKQGFQGEPQRVCRPCYFNSYNF
jgi:hypothetical protein